ncbi:MAG: ribosomal protein S18-alanine N-acetyltransferase [Firmicutes bacterium]|nr:ribosomal protein S18-alanine N-acetyltransferase [Bacillota bacterium]
MAEPEKIRIERFTSLSDEIYEIERECFGVGAWSRLEFEASLSDRGHIFLNAAYAGNNIAGFIMLSIVGDEAEIMNIAVAEKARRRGVGSALIENALLLCGERGVRAVYLEVRSKNEAARALYESVGFRRLYVRGGYYKKPTDDAVIMIKHIEGKTDAS